MRANSMYKATLDEQSRCNVLLLTISVSVLEASWARRLSAHAHRSRAAAAAVTVGVLGWVL